MPKILQELADHIGGKIIGSPDMVIRGASTLDKAQAGEITFLSNLKYAPQVKTTQAGAVLVSEPMESAAALIVVEDPYYAFMQCVVLLHGHRKHPLCGVSPQASIAPTAAIGQGCHIHPFAVIGDKSVIGNNCIIYSGAHIGQEAKIGDDCIIYPNAVVYDQCVVGNRVIIQANATVGQDGFGFATHKGNHHKIPQIGRVVLEDDVEIGAGCAIERGTLDDTIIGKGSKIGDLTAIGHGTKIGGHCLLVPQVGVAGSVVMGHHCVVGGQAGIVGHIKIGNLVKIAAKAGVANEVPDGAMIAGAPAIKAGKALRAYSLIETLPDMKKQIKNIQKQVDNLTSPK